jgi:acetate kinase
MKVLVLNCGSSSVKYELFETDPERSLASGLAERVGVSSSEPSVLHHQVHGHDSRTIEVDMPDHRAAIGEIVRALTATGNGVLASLDEIAAVGHRVVHGAERFADSTIITDEVLATIEECAELAPLHNPPNLVGIRAARELLPGRPNVAVFDTAFHQTIPRHAYLYGLPYECYEQYGIRRYGFHGTSHRYVTLEATTYLEERGVPAAEQSIVTCHLGNGCSMAAVKGGKSVDTTMGFTPLEGLLMGTRCGDVDAAAVLYLMERDALDTDAADQLLNKQSGLLGVSGVGSDLRDVLQAEADGSPRAGAAVDVFCYRIRKYIGAYAAALGALHAVVFTAGIGENSPPIRQRVCGGLELLGIRLDAAANEATVGPDTTVAINAPTAAVHVLVIPTNEELLIARDTAALL